MTLEIVYLGLAPGEATWIEEASYHFADGLLFARGRCSLDGAHIELIVPAQNLISLTVRYDNEK